MNIDEVLDELGITKKYLADRLGVSPSTIYRWKEDFPVYAVSYLKLLQENRELLSRLVSKIMN